MLNMRGAILCVLRPTIRSQLWFPWKSSEEVAKIKSEWKTGTLYITIRTVRWISLSCLLVFFSFLLTAFYFNIRFISLSGFNIVSFIFAYFIALQSDFDSVVVVVVFRCSFWILRICRYNSMRCSRSAYFFFVLCVCVCFGMTPQRLKMACCRPFLSFHPDNADYIHHQRPPIIIVQLEPYFIIHIFIARFLCYCVCACEWFLCHENERKNK